MSRDSDETGHRDGVIGRQADSEIAAAQIERPLRAASEPMARCSLNLPTVIRVPPVLDDGTPFPTRFWLTCPLANKRIGRLEGAGGVKAMERALEADQDLAAQMAATHRRYEVERDALIPDGAVYRPSGGVAGLTTGVKCLHAHYADHAAGNDNPIGALVAPWVEPLHCEIPCVVEVDGIIARNPDWREPK